MATLKERVDKHDREIAAIRKLIHIGMKMQVKNDQEIRKLVESQKETDRLLKQFLRSMERGNGNGHKTGRVD
jgi:thymidylate synthase ThyX